MTCVNDIYHIITVTKHLCLLERKCEVAIKIFIIKKNDLNNWNRWIKKRKNVTFKNSMFITLLNPKPVNAWCRRGSMYYCQQMLVAVNVYRKQSLANKQHQFYTVKVKPKNTLKNIEKCNKSNNFILNSNLKFNIE